MFPSTVVGLYGVSGCGKSHVLGKMNQNRPEWRCLDGSVVIRQVLDEHSIPWETFQTMAKEEQEKIRNLAVERIRESRGVTIVAGHASFPASPQHQEDGVVEFSNIFTDGDARTYQSIVYLDIPVEQVMEQRRSDNERVKRQRPNHSVDTIEQWIQHEKQSLRDLCKKHGIKFYSVADSSEVEACIHTQILPPSVSKAQLESDLALRRAVKLLPRAEVYLLIDGDRTLTSVDTGKLFFQHAKLRALFPDHDPLKKIFKRYDHYTFQGFLEAAMLYTNVLSQDDYEDISNEIGSNHVEVYPQWIDFLSKIPLYVHPVLVTSGNRDIWQAVLDRNKIDNMSLLAGNHLGMHPYLMDGEGKATVVSHLRKVHGGCRVFAFGDSGVDLGMIEVSDRGYVVLDDRKNRSMQEFIKDAIASGGAACLFQLHPGDNALPATAWHDGLQVAHLNNLLKHLKDKVIYRALDCGVASSAAQVLATKTRRADFSGPTLQDVHAQVGRFLADKLLDEFSSHLITTEDFDHVQEGKKFDGPVASNKVLVLPMMRGGEPLSRGVYERFPSGKVFHYWDEKKMVPCSESFTKELSAMLKDSSDIVIVDSVINQGRSVRDAIRMLQGLVPVEEKNCKRWYVLTAVMQEQASVELPKDFPFVRFVTLRVSKNQYTGRGGTDTGNRLFGTV